MTWQLRGLHRDLRPYAEYAYQLGVAYGLKPVITSGFRDWAEQDLLYKRYLAGKSRFPAAPPGQSAHNYGLAFDSWVPDRDKPIWNAIRRYVGWAVTDSDWVHAELPGWREYIF